MLRASHLAVQRGAARVSVRHSGLRHASHAANTGRASLSRRVLRWTLVGAGLGLGVTATGLGVALSRESELRATADANGTRPPTPLRELLRTYVVYGICSFPTIVDSSSTILSTLLSIPIVDKITEVVVRVTFFDQFVGADTANGCIPLLHKLRRENKGCLFAYSVEVDEDEGSPAELKLDASGMAPHKQGVQEMLKSIDAAADFEDSLGETSPFSRKTWVAIKMTALLPDAKSLVRMSQDLVSARRSHRTGIPFPDAPQPGDLDVLQGSASSGSALTPEDMHALSELRDDLIAICEKAKKRRVKVIMDAEYSWHQPAIDAFVLALMLRFNRLPTKSSPANPDAVQPLVYQTYQAYLRRTPAYLRQSLEFTRKHGLALGVKLVRGAYHPHETAAHGVRGTQAISDEALPPVWGTKAETDASYDECVKMLVEAIAEDINAPTTAPTTGWISRMLGRSSRPAPSADTDNARPPSIGVLFGTHNYASCGLILSSLAGRGLARPRADGSLVLPDSVAARVTLAQLYGMHDALTNGLVDGLQSSSPVVLKYVPYGALKEVMPYLSRRAIENKSVLFDGAGAAERQAAAKEIKSRIFG